MEKPVEFPTIDTNIATKKQLLPIFIKMIEQQTVEGAEKYGHSADREWTDVLSGVFGLDYFFMNIMKYIGRIRRGDKRAEIDHAKIATYIFLRWCKAFGAKYIEPLDNKERKW